MCTPKHNDKSLLWYKWMHGSFECLHCPSVSWEDMSIKVRRDQTSPFFVCVCVCPVFLEISLQSTHNPLVSFSMTASHQLLLGLVTWHVFTHSYPFAASLSSEGAPANSKKNGVETDIFEKPPLGQFLCCLLSQKKDKQHGLLLFILNILSFLKFPWASRCSSHTTLPGTC